MVLDGATISGCGTYRYTLERTVGLGRRYVLFVMLNPSTADASEDDPTIRRCIGYARAWGLGGLKVGNLFAYRATSPSDMRSADDPVGPLNDSYLQEMAARATLIVCAWGNHGSFLGRDNEVLRILYKPHALRLSKSGQPAHPLYLPKNLKPFALTKDTSHE